MELIQLEHRSGTSGDKNTNVGFIAASSSGGEIVCSWRSSTLPAIGSQLEGQSFFKPSSPLYRTENTAVAGALTIPLSRLDATFALVTFLNNTELEASIKLTAAIGNSIGTSMAEKERIAKVQPGDSASFYIAFIAK